MHKHACSQTLSSSVFGLPGHSRRWPAPAASAGWLPQRLQGALTQKMGQTHWQRAWETCGFLAEHSGSCWTFAGVGAAAVGWLCLSRSCSRPPCCCLSGSCPRAGPGSLVWLAASDPPWSPEASGVCCLHTGQLGKSWASWLQCPGQAPILKGKHTHTGTLCYTLHKDPFQAGWPK